MSKSSHQKNQNSLLYLFGKLWQYSAGNRRMVVLYWCMFILAVSIVVLIRPLVRSSMIDTLQVYGVSDVGCLILSKILITFLLLELAFWIFHGPARVIEIVNAFKVRTNYRHHLLKGVMTLPLEWHTDHHSGDTIDKIEKGSSALHDFSKWSFKMIYNILMLSFSYIAISIYFGIFIGLITTVMFAIAAFIIMRFDNVLIGRYKQLSLSENHISESIFDSISNITTVIILRVEKVVFDSIMRAVNGPFELFKRTTILEEVKWFLTAICCRLMQVMALGLYFYQCKSSPDPIQLGKVYLLLQYLENIGDIFFDFAGMYGDILKQKARVMNAEVLAEDFREENFTNHVLPENWKRLAIRDLRFSYNGNTGEKLDLDRVSLSVGHGERIACVGETGSGKTTLLKIIRGLYCRAEIDLSVDEQDIPQGFDGICRAITLVPQDPEIFATTILANITMGAEYSKEMIRKFTDIARFSEVVDGLPRGLQSKINEKGVNLSGGQKQRLALARGLLACEGKDIVLLDEPTSSLDVATEMEVYGNIFREFRGKTIISSIHRLHLLPLFDRICVFDKGKMIASGTLAELLDTCPMFVSLWESTKIATDCSL